MKVSAAAAIAPARIPLRGGGAQGYRLSSDELRAGLEVQTLSITSLPVELVSELLRMRKSWEPAANAEAMVES